MGRERRRDCSTAQTTIAANATGVLSVVSVKGNGMKTTIVVKYAPVGRDDLAEKVEVLAEKVPHTKHFYVRRDIYSRLWVSSSTKYGLCIPANFNTKKTAIAFTQKLLSLIDEEAEDFCSKANAKICERLLKKFGVSRRPG